MPRVYECGLDPQPWIAIPHADQPLQLLADALDRRGYAALAASLVAPIADEDIILLEAGPAFSLAGGVS